jgi:NAD kinase
MSPIDKIVVVTRRTSLQELSDRLGTKAQAKFYIEQEAARQRSVGDAETAPSFSYYEQTDAVYQQAIQRLRADLPGTTRVQFVDSTFLPTFTFGPGDLIVVVGADGLVVNTAKYLDGQPLLAVNPDPATIEGVLLPYNLSTFGAGLRAALDGACPVRSLTMAEAQLSDGQVLRAVNDLFIGQRTHVSARYRLGIGGAYEAQSSSGVIVSTGTGSTGWLRSVVAGAAGIIEAFGGDPGAASGTDAARFAPTAQELRFSVREPWASRTSGATLVHGRIGPGEALEIVSQMPQNGCIFSDGIEADYLPFNSGTVARIILSDRTVSLLVPH